jgi:4'-phosphopantetheinyl transferase
MKSHYFSHQKVVSINLWIVPIDAGSVPIPYESLNILSGSEKQRFRRLQFEPDRRRFLASRVLLRTALSCTVGEEVSPQHWRFSHNAYGKPAIDPKTSLPKVHFNLSHCAQMAVAAVSRSCRVGVDVESLMGVSGADYPGNTLSSRERTWLENRPFRLRGQDFIRIWTVKEAYSKLLGRGVSLDFGSLEVTLDPQRIVHTGSRSRKTLNLYLESCTVNMPGGPCHLSLAAFCPPCGKLEVNINTLPDLRSVQARCIG